MGEAEAVDETVEAEDEVTDASEEKVEADGEMATATTAASQTTSPQIAQCREKKERQWN